MMIPCEDGDGAAGERYPRRTRANPDTARHRTYARLVARGGYGGQGLPLHARARSGSAIPPTDVPPPDLAPLAGVSPRAAQEGVAVDPCPARHCWVSRPVVGGPPRPGLLLEWRRRAGDDWEGRVVYPVELRRGSWATVEEWLPASGLTTAVL